LIVLQKIASVIPTERLPTIKIEWPEATRGWSGEADGGDAPLLQGEEGGDHEEEV